MYVCVCVCVWTFFVGLSGLTERDISADLCGLLNKASCCESYFKRTKTTTILYGESHPKPKERKKERKSKKMSSSFKSRRQIYKTLKLGLNLHVSPANNIAYMHLFLFIYFFDYERKKEV